MIKKYRKNILKFIQSIILASGVMAIIFVLLSFTDIPFYAYYALGSPKSTLYAEPDVIVIMGSGGMPDPDGLIRCYYGSESANLFDSANVVIALPGNENDLINQPELMAKELIVRGVDSSRIFFEPNGYNTWSQAENLADKFKDQLDTIQMLIVTTPDHMYRTVHTFRNMGFAHVGGKPAFERVTKPERLKKDHSDKDIKLAFRYNMWSYMQYEIKVLREYIAILVYKLRGWI